MAATWYMGPDGDLRALTCPEPDIATSLVRYGGIHQGLSGARTLDVTGHRKDYTFQFDHVDPADWAWMQAMHSRHIQGPFRLIDPLFKNRLSLEASSCKANLASARGMWLAAGNSLRAYDWPSAAGTLGNQSTKWFNRPASYPARFDNDKRTPVFPLETIVGSMYMKASAGFSGTMGFDWFDITGTQFSSTSTTVSPTTSWARYSYSSAAPAGAVSAKYYFYTANTAADLYLAAAQVEAGATPTSWELGGGAPVVLLDQLATVSHRYPITNVTMTLLEA